MPVQSSPASAGRPEPDDDDLPPVPPQRAVPELPDDDIPELVEDEPLSLPEDDIAELTEEEPSAPGHSPRVERSE